jgi:hypothetical protein
MVVLYASAVTLLAQYSGSGVEEPDAVQTKHSFNGLSLPQEAMKHTTRTNNSNFTFFIIFGLGLYKNKQ